MNTSLKNEDGSTANVESEALLSLEITECGIRRVCIYANECDPDQQSAAYALLAKVAPQLTLLQAALKAK